VCVLAAVGIVVTAIFLAVNIRFRHHRYFTKYQLQFDSTLISQLGVACAHLEKVKIIELINEFKARF